MSLECDAAARSGSIRFKARSVDLRLCGCSRSNPGSGLVHRGRERKLCIAAFSRFCVANRPAASSRPWVSLLASGTFPVRSCRSGCDAPRPARRPAVINAPLHKPKRCPDRCWSRRGKQLSKRRRLPGHAAAAALRVSSSCTRKFGSSGASIAIRAARGTAARSNSTRLAASVPSAEIRMPVTLASGRARFITRPSAIGSKLPNIRIGTVDVVSRAPLRNPAPKPGGKPRQRRAEVRVVASLDHLVRAQQ